MTEKYVITCELTDEQCLTLKAVLDGMQTEYSVAVLLGNRAVEEQPVFRFELFFNGEYQAVGLLQGLDDIVGPATYHKLIKPFNDNLPVPIDITTGCSFWFTEKGLITFTPAIDAINECIRDKGWEVRGSYLLIHESEILYEDELQVALDEYTVDDSTFIPFEKATDIMSLYEKECA